MVIRTIELSKCFSIAKALAESLVLCICQVFPRDAVVTDPSPFHLS